MSKTREAVYSAESIIKKISLKDRRALKELEGWLVQPLDETELERLDDVLCEATKQGQVAILKRLFSNPVLHLDVNKLLYGKTSCLHEAVRAGQEQCVDFLLKQGADQMMANSEGQLPIHLAVVANQRAIVEKLLKAHPAVYQCGDQNGNTPLHLAVTHDRPDLAVFIVAQHKQALLLQNNTHTNPFQQTWDIPGRSIFIRILRESRLDVENVLSLLKQCQLVSSPGTPEAALIFVGAVSGRLDLLQRWQRDEKEGWWHLGSRSPLSVAICHNQLEAAKWLNDLFSRKYIYINDKSRYGVNSFSFPSSPLLTMAEASFSNEMLAWFFKSSSTELQTKDTAGNTFLLLSAYYGKTERVKWLLKHGAHLDERNIAGENAFMMAVKNCQIETMDFLFREEKACIDYINTDGYSSLLTAAVQGHGKAAEWLMSKKGHVFVRTNAACTKKVLDVVSSLKLELFVTLLPVFLKDFMYEPEALAVVEEQYRRCVNAELKGAICRHYAFLLSYPTDYYYDKVMKSAEALGIRSTLLTLVQEGGEKEGNCSPLAAAGLFSFHNAPVSSAQLLQECETLNKQPT